MVECDMSMIPTEHIVDILNRYIHIRQDREVMTIFLTNRPRSLEVLAEECSLSVSTVKRILERNKYIYSLFMN